MNNRTKRFTYLALLSAMAIAVHILETAILPPFFGIFRIGLANIIALIAIYMLGLKEVWIINMMRVVIGSLLSGMFLGSSFWISMGGVLLSCIAISLCTKIKSSMMFTAVMSAVAHSLGQVLVVLVYYMQPAFIAILPYFLALSIPTGFLTGFVANIAIKRVKPLRK